MLYRIVSPLLDQNIYWYALNPDLCGTEPRLFSRYHVFRLLKDEIKLINIKEISQADGREVPAKWFLSSGCNTTKSRVNQIYIGSTLGILAGVLASYKEGKRNSTIVTALRGLFKLINEQRLQVDGSEERRCSPRLSAKRLSAKRVCQNKTPSQAQSPRCRRRLKLKSPPFYKKPANITQSTTAPATSIAEIRQSHCLTPPVKQRKIRSKAKHVLSLIKNVCASSSETLADVMSECCVLPKSHPSYLFVRETVSDVFDQVVSRKGAKRTFSDLISDETREKHLASFRIPDWQNLLLKLETRTSDKSWQMVLNRTKLGRNKVSFIFLE